MDAWMVYGTRTCPYTIKAMNLLRAKNISYRFVDVSDKSDRFKIIEKSSQKTIPVIYRNSKLIGGFTDLERLFK